MPRQRTTTATPPAWTTGEATDISIDHETQEWRVPILEGGREIGTATGPNREQVEATARRIAATPTVIAALEATLPELGELLTHWENEAASFDLPEEEAERRMAQINAEGTRARIALVQAALQLAGPPNRRKPSTHRSRA